MKVVYSGWKRVDIPRRVPWTYAEIGMAVLAIGVLAYLIYEAVS